MSAYSPRPRALRTRRLVGNRHRLCTRLACRALQQRPRATQPPSPAAAQSLKQELVGRIRARTGTRVSSGASAVSASAETPPLDGERHSSRTATGEALGAGSRPVRRMLADTFGTEAACHFVAGAGVERPGRTAAVARGARSGAALRLPLRRGSGGRSRAASCRARRTESAGRRSATRRRFIQTSGNGVKMSAS